MEMAIPKITTLKIFFHFDSIIPNSCEKNKYFPSSERDIIHLNMLFFNLENFFPELFPWPSVDHRWAIPG